ncbi:hypothetical protein AB8O64_19880 [Streptomyces sp. QH1-20]|uniref:hypothetical protein n=1 Tax=Streptomyces sp. QH1-20 TaxID=3240934 RepID=UPI00351162BE
MTTTSHSPEVTRALRQLKDARSEAVARGASSTAYVRMLDEIAELVINTGNPAEVGALVLDVLAKARANKSAEPCSVYPWCAERGDHDDHIGAVHTITAANGDELICAHLLHLAGTKPLIGLEGADLNADEARVKARELRTLADGIVVMADALDAITTAHS